MRKPKSVDAYIAMAPKEVRNKLKELRAAIRGVAPAAEERISYGMPYYRYKGRLAYFAVFTKHIGLYVPPPVIEEHKRELTGYETAKATVRFPLDKKLPVVLIRKLIKAGMKKNEARSDLVPQQKRTIEPNANDAAKQKGRTTSRMTIVRTDAAHHDFMELVKLLDADLARRDGEVHSFYAQFNKIDKIKYVVLAYENDKPLGCGAMKEHGSDTVEIKRMYVAPVSRKKGIATAILSELEKWAMELSYAKCILETGKKQPEAIGLYKKNGYRVIPNYGQYAEAENSVCFEKHMRDE